MATMQKVTLPTVELIRPNFTRVDLGNGSTLWFSYQTLVGFQTAESGLYVSENCWSKTTGRHLNMIGPLRTPRAAFEAKYAELFGG